jgi:hypothetical protein
VAKIKLDFIDFLGVGGADWCSSVTLFFIYIQLYLGTLFVKKKKIRVKFGTFQRSVRKHPFGWWKIKKKRWKFRGFSSRTG